MVSTCSLRRKISQLPVLRSSGSPSTPHQGASAAATAGDSSGSAWVWKRSWPWPDWVVCSHCTRMRATASGMGPSWQNLLRSATMAPSAFSARASGAANSHSVANSSSECNTFSITCVRSAATSCSRSACARVSAVWMLAASICAITSQAMRTL